MSILDGLPGARAEEILPIIGPIIEERLKGLELTPRQQSVLDLQQKGLSIADIFNITKEERDALFMRSWTLIQAGKLQKARDDLLLLYHLEPLDARAMYGLGVIYQLEGNVSTAAKLYVFFLALDATNAEGYLRLGECLMAAGEYDKAEEMFGIAKKECDRGNGNAAAAALVVNRIAELKDKRSIASIAPKSASTQTKTRRKR